MKPPAMFCACSMEQNVESKYQHSVLLNETLASRVSYTGKR